MSELRRKTVGIEILMNFFSKSFAEKSLYKTASTYCGKSGAVDWADMSYQLHITGLCTNTCSIIKGTSSGMTDLLSLVFIGS